MSVRIRPNSDFIKYWLPVILSACFIFWMSTSTFSAENTFSVIGAVIHFLIPRVSSEKVVLIHALIRKLAHVFEYFILGLLLFRAFRGHATDWWTWRWFLFTSIVVLLWAAGDEYHQSFVPTRTASIIDVGIDMVGGILGAIVSALWHRYRNR